FTLSGNGNLANGINGNGGSDSLTGADSTNTWVISGDRAGTLNRMSFMAIEGVFGGSGSDTFALGVLAALPQGINGGGGIDTISGPDVTLRWQITGDDAGDVSRVIT